MVQYPMLSLEIMRSWVERHQSEWLEDYYAFLRFASISSEPESKPALLNCVEWLTDYVGRLDFQVETWQSKGHPILFASHKRAGPDQPTLLIYNHYDVQPVDPIEGWRSPPFEPVLRDGEIYARGAQDNKGQCFYVLQALKMWKECVGSLPINVKLCIEGEEEMGSPNLATLLAAKKEALQADYVAIVDLGLRQAAIPALTLGIRGIITLDVGLKGSETDLHSGSHGGIVVNPIHALVKLLAGLHDEKGKITIPDFYQEVEEVPLDKSLSLEFDCEEYRRRTGAVPEGGEREYSPLERAWLRPTLEINGISGGYSGAGFKTVIPAQAWAKISCRLVPHQQPERIAELVATYLKQQAPLGMTVSVEVHPGKGKAVRVNADARAVRSFGKAFQEVFDTPCECILEGASIPIVAELAEASGGETILLGLGLSTDHIHAPNEHFGLDRLKNGMLVIARALELLKN